MAQPSGFKLIMVIQQSFRLCFGQIRGKRIGTYTFSTCPCLFFRIRYKNKIGKLLIHHE